MTDYVDKKIAKLEKEKKISKKKEEESKIKGPENFSKIINENDIKKIKKFVEYVYKNTKRNEKPRLKIEKTAIGVIFDRRDTDIDREAVPCVLLNYIYDLNTLSVLGTQNMWWSGIDPSNREGLKGVTREGFECNKKGKKAALELFMDLIIKESERESSK